MDEGAGGEERGLGGAGQKFRSEGRMRDVVRCWTDRPTDWHDGSRKSSNGSHYRKEGGREGRDCGDRRKRGFGNFDDVMSSPRSTKTRFQFDHFKKVRFTIRGEKRIAEPAAGMASRAQQLVS